MTNPNHCTNVVQNTVRFCGR